MTYIEKAKSVYSTGYAKLTEIKTTIDTIQRINFRLTSAQYRQLAMHHRQMMIDLDELNVCLAVHEAMEEPDNETIASVIKAEAEVYAGIYTIEELIRETLSSQ